MKCWLRTSEIGLMCLTRSSTISWGRKTEIRVLASGSSLVIILRLICLLLLCCTETSVMIFFKPNFEVICFVLSVDHLVSKDSWNCMSCYSFVKVFVFRLHCMHHVDAANCHTSHAAWSVCLSVLGCQWWRCHFVGGRLMWATQELCITRVIP